MRNVKWMLFTPILYQLLSLHRCHNSIFRDRNNSSSSSISGGGGGGVGGGVGGSSSSQLSIVADDDVFRRRISCLQPSLLRERLCQDPRGISQSFRFLLIVSLYLSFGRPIPRVPSVSCEYSISFGSLVLSSLLT